jgi:hypothetical protein
VSHFTLFVDFSSGLHDLGCIISQKTHSTSYFSNEKIFRVPTTQKTVFFTVFVYFGSHNSRTINFFNTDLSNLCSLANFKYKSQGSLINFKI